MQCLSFYSLAKSPKNGNVAPGLLESLLAPDEQCPNKPVSTCEELDKLIDNSFVDAASATTDHIIHYIAEYSDDRLVYYSAGYAAMKQVIPQKRQACSELCLLPKDEIPMYLPTEVTKEWDNVGLPYPPLELFYLISTLESRLAGLSSTKEVLLKQCASLHIR